MKAIALRPRDIADIELISAASHEVDLTRIRGLLKAVAPTTPALRAGSSASGVG